MTSQVSTTGTDAFQAKTEARRSKFTGFQSVKPKLFQSFDFADNAELILPAVRVLTVGNLFPPHHFGGYEQVWESAVQSLRARNHDVRVLVTTFRHPAVTGEDAPRGLSPLTLVLGAGNV